MRLPFKPGAGPDAGLPSMHVVLQGQSHLTLSRLEGCGPAFMQHQLSAAIPNAWGREGGWEEVSL